MTLGSEFMQWDLIRNMVYKSAFALGEMIPRCCPAQPFVCRTSRQIRRESLALFFQHQPLLFPSYAAPYHPHSALTSKFDLECTLWLARNDLHVPLMRKFVSTLTHVNNGPTNHEVAEIVLEISGDFKACHVSGEYKITDENGTKHIKSLQDHLAGLRYAANSATKHKKILTESALDNIANNILAVYDKFRSGSVKLTTR